VLFRGQPEAEEETGEFDDDGNPKIKRRKADDEHLIRKALLDARLIDAVISSSSSNSRPFREILVDCAKPLPRNGDRKTMAKCANGHRLAVDLNQIVDRIDS
jgi:hypothetical protein